MAVDAGTAFIDVKADASGFGSDLKKQVGGFSSTFASIGKGVALGITAAAVGVGIVAKQSIDAARESIKVQAQTEAVIKSTGGAAGVTGKQVGDYSHQLQNLSGVQDENIQSGANMLLTFTNIRNGVGAGNDIFNQATATALDMSVALGTDVPQAALQLGKALNDPIKGMTALQRVGVTFTQEQKDQVAALVASGDTMGAQKVILAELNKEFGGSAKAAGDALDPMQRLSLAWGDMQEQIGMFLIPILGKLTEFLVSKILPAARRLFDFLGVLGKAFVAAFSGEGVTSDGIVGVFERIGVAARKVVDWFQTSVMPVLRQFGDFLKANMQPVLIGVAVALGVVTVALVALAVAEIVAAAVPLLIVAALAALVAALVYAYTHFEALRVVVQAVTTFFTAVLIPTVTAVATFLITQIGNAVAYVVAIWPQISEAIGHVMVLVQEHIQAALAVATALWHTFGDDILTFVTGAFNAILNVIGGVMQIVRGIIQTVLALINGDCGRAWDGVKMIVSGALQVVLGLIQSTLNTIRFAIGSALGAIQGIWSAGWNALSGAVSGAFRFIVGAVSGGIGDVIGLVASLPGRITGAVGDLSGILVDAGRAIIRGLIDGVESMLGALGDKLGAVGSFIKDHKGPPEHDKVMLRPAGRLLMQGLMAGIDDLRPALASQLSDLTNNDLTVGVNPTLNTGKFSVPRSVLDGLGTSGGSAGPAVQVGDIYVSGVSDPEAAADMVISKLNTRLRLG